MVELEGWKLFADLSAIARIIATSVREEKTFEQFYQFSIFFNVYGKMISYLIRYSPWVERSSKIHGGIYVPLSGAHQRQRIFPKGFPAEKCCSKPEINKSKYYLGHIAVFIWM